MVATHIKANSNVFGIVKKIKIGKSAAKYPKKKDKSSTISKSYMA
jgi:hypothetical protein